MPDAQARVDNPELLTPPDMHASPLTVAGVPLLLATPEESRTPLPTVLWFHGFRADALAHAAELERCADAGFLAVGIDAAGHGARRDLNMAARIAASGGAMPVVLDLIEQTLTELPALRSALVTEHNADPHRISMVGISMGAFLAYRAALAAPTPRAVVALLGSPAWARASDQTFDHDAYRHVALLSVTAEHDVSVPPDAVEALHALLGARAVPQAPHQHHTLLGAGHLTSASQWAEAMRVTFAWLDEHAR